MHTMPFGPKDLIVAEDPGSCPLPSSSASNKVEVARCKNWELGRWYLSHVVQTDAADQNLTDLDAFTRNERMQLTIAGVGLGTVVAGIGVALFR